MDIEPTSRLEIVDGRIYDEDYMQCSNFVWKNFEVEFQKSYLDYLPEVLLKYRVLVYYQFIFINLIILEFLDNLIFDVQ